MKQPTILALSSWYLPGFKGGGPIRTLVNIIQHLEQDFRFKVVTRDRDLGDGAQFDGITPGEWRQTGAGEVNYLGPADRTWQRLRGVIRDAEPDLLYLNSFFDPTFSVTPLLLRRSGLIPGRLPVVVAPRGEFAPPALAIKPRRKALFLGLAKLLGLCHRIIWQAGGEHEEQDIRKIWGKKAQIVITPDLPPKLGNNILSKSHQKIPGELRIVFLSRLAPIKNLIGALHMLAGISEQVEFDIYGPIEDGRYWTECQSLIRTLPAEIKVRYCGPVANNEVAAVFAGYDLLFLPTLGESFGHVILEAMLSGCPVLISDKTPWRRLEERKAGWDIPLNESSRFQGIIRQMAQMDEIAYRPWSRGARNLGVIFSTDQAVVDVSRSLFAAALSDSFVV